MTKWIITTKLSPNKLKELVRHSCPSEFINNAKDPDDCNNGGTRGECKRCWEKALKPYEVKE
jgi:hypothetical protein